MRITPNHARVAGIAVRTKRMGPMQEIDAAQVVAGSGIEGDLRVSRKRGVTFISNEQWHEVVTELGVPLPWHTRRANVLVDGLRLGETIGKVLSIGDVEIRIHGETEPCSEMDRLHHGLQAALTPELRGGVHGEVLRGGTIRVDDQITVTG